MRLVSGALSRIGRSEHGDSEAKLARQICGNELEVQSVLSQNLLNYLKLLYLTASLSGLVKYAG